MNKDCYRLVFSRVRNMLVAVADFATARGNGQNVSVSSTPSGADGPDSSSLYTSLRAIALVAMLLVGWMPALSLAQIVAAPGSGAQVIQTQNGLPQVNIARPGDAGVS